MKRLLPGLRSFNVVGALLALAAVPLHGMRREEPQPKIDRTFIQEAFRVSDPLRTYVATLHSTANLFCLQDEIVKLIKEVKKESSLLKNSLPADDEAVTIDNPKSLKEIFSKMFTTGSDSNELQTPEGIAFALNVANSLINMDSESIDWNFIQQLNTDSNSELSKIANSVLRMKNILNAGKNIQRNKGKQKLLLSENIKFSCPISLKIYAKAIKNFDQGQINSSKQLFNLLDRVRQKNNYSIEEVQNFMTSHPELPPVEIFSHFAHGLTVEDLKFFKDLGLEEISMQEEMIATYDPVRELCCKIYRAIKTELNRAILGLPEEEQKQYKNKIYAQALLPNELLVSIEPVAQLVETAPAQESPIQKEKIVEKSPKNSKKNKPKNGKKASNIKPVAHSIQPTAVHVLAANTVKKPVAKNVIKDFIDSMNSMSIHLYCSCKQKKDVPVFSRHPRLLQWFEDPKKALVIQGYENPQNPKHKFIDTAIAYHSFSLDVDAIALKFGTQYERVDANGKRTLFIALPGHIEKNGQRIFGIFGYAIDPETKVCYHRCFEPRTTQELLSEYLNDESWKVTLEDLAEA